MKNMLKDALILMAITLVAGAFLGLVHEITKKPIAQQQEKAKTDAYAEVFKDADHFTALEGFDTDQALSVLQENNFDNEKITEVMMAFDKNQQLLGYVITVDSTEGYSGDIVFSMGVSLNGTINGVSVLSISETAGLGMNAEELLAPQFAGKNVDQFSYTKDGATIESQIDAISGATITTKAVTEGVNAGLVYFRTLSTGGNEND